MRFATMLFLALGFTSTSFAAEIEVKSISAPTKAGLKRSQMRAAITPQFPELKKCLLEAAPGLKSNFGQFSFNIVMNARGQITRVNSLSNTTQNNVLNFCLANRLSMVTFPKPKIAEGFPIYLQLTFELPAKVQQFQTPSPYISMVMDSMEHPFLTFDSKWFAEAPKGKEFSIRIYNPFDLRMAVSLIVDGMNTIDGNMVSPESGRKWIISPGQLTEVRGWQITPSQLRRFVFSGETAPSNKSVGLIQAIGYKEQAFYDGKASKDKSGAGVEVTKVVKTEDLAKGTNAVKAVNLNLESSPTFTVQIKYDTKNNLSKIGLYKPTKEKSAAASDGSNAEQSKP